MSTFGIVVVYGEIGGGYGEIGRSTVFVAWRLGRNTTSSEDVSRTTPIFLDLSILQRNWHQQNVRKRTL